ncbi:hypothetical protein AWA1501_25400 [Lactiplantibacillus pentosus]|nr:hypothetical protein AWA1501_25400 [Lactiplantibacillus pentosus]
MSDFQLNTVGLDLIVMPTLTWPSPQTLSSPSITTSRIGEYCAITLMNALAMPVLPQQPQIPL